MAPQVGGSHQSGAWVEIGDHRFHYCAQKMKAMSCLYFIHSYNSKYVEWDANTSATASRFRRQCNSVILWQWFQTTQLWDFIHHLMFNNKIFNTMFHKLHLLSSLGCSCQSQLSSIYGCQMKRTRGSEEFYLMGPPQQVLQPPLWPENSNMASCMSNLCVFKYLLNTKPNNTGNVRIM